jgi:hypothetical protein
MEAASAHIRIVRGSRTPPESLQVRDNTSSDNKACADLCKTQRYADNRGKIDKQKRFVIPEMGRLEAEARVIIAERQRKKLLALQQQQKHEAAQARQRAEYETYLRNQRRREALRLLPPEEPIHTTDLPDPDPIGDHIERHRFVQEKLTSILGAERMNAPILPSGHSPIDPVIAEYNQQQALNALAEYDAEQRRIAEEQYIRQQQEQEQAFKINVLVDHYRAKYVQRVEQLEQCGPYLALGVDKLETAVSNKAMDEDTTLGVLQMTHEILIPSLNKLKEMDPEIPLDVEGAQRLKAAWPFDRLKGVFGWMLSEATLPPELIKLGKCIKAVCGRIDNPQVWEHPLTPKPQPTYGSLTQMDNAPTNNLSFQGAATMSINPPSAPADFNGAAPNAPAAEDDGRKNYGSWADLTAAAKQANQQATASQQTSSVPITFPTPLPPNTTNNSSPDSQEKANIIGHFCISQPQLLSSVDDLLNANISSTARKDAARADVMACLKELLDNANGKRGILGDDDGAVWKDEIARVKKYLAELPEKAAKKKLNRNLEKVIEEVMKLWV